MSSSITQRRSFTALSRARRSTMSPPAAGCDIHVFSSADSSLRTLASLAGSLMRSDLICRIAILSRSSPKETGTRISDMAVGDEGGKCGVYPSRVATAHMPICKRRPKAPRAFAHLAERVGFEPTVRLHVRLISSQVHSTTLPPLRWSCALPCFGRGANDTGEGLQRTSCCMRGRTSRPSVVLPHGRLPLMIPFYRWRPIDDSTEMIEFGHLTHVGLRRELNEDTYYGDSELGLWLVADGMGGHEYGEVA